MQKYRKTFEEGSKGRGEKVATMEKNVITPIEDGKTL